MRLIRNIVALMVVSVVGQAQTPTGEITGTVYDPSGAAVVNATVTAVNSGNAQQRTSTTNDAGIYSLPALQPGSYTLRVSAAGFSAVEQKNLEVQVGQVARLDFRMQVGNVNETVQVTSQAPQLQTETTELGTVIENKRIVDLPLNGRNYLQLASLVPGATTNGPASSQGQQRMGGQRNSFALNVAGQRVHYNHYTLDGVENTDPNFNTYMLLPSVDALQEFKVESGIFQAEYGRAIAQVNVTTKGGTNQLHGSLFHFLRNSALDAKNYFDRGDRPIPPFKRNQFGATVGGPVVLPKLVDGRNRLFWLFSFEGLRERKALTQTGVVPPAAIRGGDLSSLGGTIVDPLTRTVGANGQISPGTPFAGNVIPANRIAPISAAILARYYPAPNLTGPNNFINNEGRRFDNDQYNARIDFNESNNSNWFFRYSNALDRGYLPAIFPDTGNNVNIDAHQGVLANTRLFGGTKVNEFRFAVNRMVSQNIQQRANRENVVAALGIPGVPTDIPLFWGIPFIQIAGYNSVGECNDCPFVNWNTNFQVRDDFSWVKGRHTMKFGGDFRRLRYNQIGAVVPRGRFNFSGQYSNNAFADYLLGFMNNSEGQVGAPVANMRNYQVAFYFQDQWKVTNKLTVNYGLRWELEPPFLDKHDAIVNIDFKWDNSVPPTFVRAGTGDPYEGFPQFRLPPTIPYVRDGRFGRRAYRTDRNDFGPRLGIAYQLTPKTVLRTGAGIYYVRDIANATFDIVRNAPFTIRRNEAANTTAPNLSWNRPFTITGSPTFILANQFNEPSTYVAQWSAGIQRELTSSMSLEVAYLGSAGVHLRRLASYNDPLPGPGNIQARRPFPAIGNVQVMYAPGHSSYHALQMRLQQRLSRGVTLLSAYSWSKSIDNGSGIRTTDGDALLPSNVYNLDAERGLSAFDFRHRWTNSFLYELPFGRGRQFLARSNGFVNAVLGGWQLGGIITLQSGFPLSAFCGPGNWQNGGGTCYADATGINPNLPRGQQDPRRWFNTAAFVNRLNWDPNNPQFRFGNAGRNTIIGPGLIAVDASLNKSWTIREGQRLEFRTEVFNAPNHPLWGQPGTSPGAPTYGVITSTRVDPRDIQLALKYVF